MADVQWRMSSYTTGNGGDCVEVACLLGLVAVRDSKNRDGGTLCLSLSQWHGFLAAMKRGVFDP